MSRTLRNLMYVVRLYDVYSVMLYKCQAPEHRRLRRECSVDLSLPSTTISEKAKVKMASAACGLPGQVSGAGASPTEARMLGRPLASIYNNCVVGNCIVMMHPYNLGRHYDPVFGTVEHFFSSLEQGGIVCESLHAEAARLRKLASQAKLCTFSVAP